MRKKGGRPLALVAALRLLGVRDWRCYGLAFAWVPVLHGLRLGTAASSRRR